ncbi:MAG: AAA family ATPase, partial [Gammaproteobacteria bacterium]|nr:AAA family ATPase [Gammaproteobacteria bacterium]
HLLFLRPHRFGKSMLLSMLENYYDLAKAEQFESICLRPKFNDLCGFREEEISGQIFKAWPN